MTFKDFYRREKYVAMHAQTRRFRVVKYIVIGLILLALYFWKGLLAVGILLLLMIIVGTSTHFFLRWKTAAWTKSWGPYKQIPFEDIK